MTGRGMLFSGDSVRAILAGRKTQTRRVILQAINEVGEPAVAVCHCEADDSWIAWWGPPRDYEAETRRYYPNGGGFHPPLAPGDRIWVRETWAQCYAGEERGGRPCYRADVGIEGNATKIEESKVIRWRPSIHMPQWAARLWLEVVDVRVQQLQDISAKDVEAEGISQREDYPIKDAACGWHEPFAALWDSINAKCGHQWDANPWVWAITFRRIER